MARRFIVRHEYFETRSKDGVRIAGAHLMARDLDSPDYGHALVVVHGLLSNHRAPGMLECAESLTRFGPVWTIDLRGHGFSGGQCTLGNKEADDVGAVTREVRKVTDLPIVLIGFSMGGAAVIRSAALIEPVSAVVAVSPPAKWGGHRRRAAKRTRSVWRIPGGRTALRLFTGVRLAARFERHESPRSVIGKISPSPILIVYGDKDHFFPITEAENLLEEAGEPKELWVIEDGGHAEGLFYEAGESVVQTRVDDFVDELMKRVEELLSPAQ